MVYVLAEVFIPDNYLGHESMRRHESMRIRHNNNLFPDFFYIIGLDQVRLDLHKVKNNMK
jgi:hypothetical protein